MNDQGLFQLVRGADPLAATFGQPTEALFERVLAAARAEPRASARIGRHRRNWSVLVAAALALVVVSAGLAVTAVGWLSGSPAPPAVVTDFEAYTPQLGFHPEPGSAVLVARDGSISLYATTNREHAYCLVVDTPWKPPQALDGGTCVPTAISSAHLVAGIVGAASSRDGGGSTFVIAGRIDNPAARTIRFTAPDGTVVSRPVGASGFFVAALRAPDPLCARDDWNPTFTGLDATGNKLAQATIPIMHARNRGVCMLSGLRR
jgi:hypothetical protein